MSPEQQKVKLAFEVLTGDVAMEHLLVCSVFLDKGSIVIDKFIDLPPFIHVVACN